MKAAFFGTPQAAIPSLRALHRIANVVGVVTRPDAPRGRSGRPQPSPVAAFATDAGIPVHRPEKRADLIGTVEQMSFDVGVVVAFGMILPAAMLDAPRGGFVNVHFSVLPRWRGAAPVARALLAGDDRTGVTLMQMDPGLDTGPVIATWSTGIGADESTTELTDRLALEGGRLLATVLEAHVDGHTAVTPQDESRATYAAKLASDERWIRPTDTARAAALAVRGLAAWPGAWIEHDSGPVRIRQAITAPDPLPPGAVVGVDGRVVLGFGDGSIEALEVQPAGRRAMPASDWYRGLHTDGGRFR